MIRSGCIHQISNAKVIGIRICDISYFPGVDPGFDQGGGPDRDRPKLLMVCSSVMRAKLALFSVGSGACLRAPEALGYFITKYAFSPFWDTFLYYF